jgi:4-hydroxy-tetrahydrodipicolinate reductase
MNIALIGYGKMGKAIEKIAVERGHKITEIVDNSNDFESFLNNHKADVAIEFSVPIAAKENVTKCLQKGISVVSGTTAWEIDNDVISNICKNKKNAFFYAPNFSIGVNVFMEINRKLADLLSNFPDFSVELIETHHIHKLDKPSGTAISIANDIIDNNDNYQHWTLDDNKNQAIPITAIREREVVGNHIVEWNSKNDIIRIEHNAKNREGFAIGSVLAAEFICKKIGVFSMKDLLDI